MHLHRNLFAIIALLFCTLISCKKEAINLFQYQEGVYIGSRHFTSLRYIYHYNPVTFDSITLEPTSFEEWYEPIKVDTTFIDTARIEIFKDSISFDTYLVKLKLPINEDNIYKITSYGAAGISLTHTICGDTLKITHYYIIDKNSNYSGSGANNFVGIK